MPRAAKLRTVPEGPEKFCNGCQEWWPADREFWHLQRESGNGLGHRCRACYAEEQAARRAARRGEHQEAPKPTRAVTFVFVTGHVDFFNVEMGDRRFAAVDLLRPSKSTTGSGA